MALSAHIYTFSTDYNHHRLTQSAGTGGAPGFAIALSSSLYANAALAPPSPGLKKTSSVKQPVRVQQGAAVDLLRSGFSASQVGAVAEVTMLKIRLIQRRGVC